MRTASVASIVLPPVPFLLAAVVVLLVLVATLVALGRRRRASEGGRAAVVGTGAGQPVDSQPVADQPVEERTGHAPAREVPAAPEGLPTGADSGPSDSVDVPADDPRALRLLVRTLEAAIEELSADLALTAKEQRNPATAAGPSALADAVAALRRPEALAARRAELIGEALQGVDETDLAARLNAALARTGAPRSFARPALAVCTGVELPELRRADTVRGPELPVRVPADAVAVPEPDPVPTEPERVLPVPAPPAPAPTPRRRLFGRRVA